LRRRDSRSRTGGDLLDDGKGSTMLGDKIGDLRGQNISTRVLPDEGHGPRMEITDQETGTMYGVQVTSTVTYIGTMRPNGTISGDAVGITMGENGEAATFRGSGVGTFIRPGVTTWRGTLFFETESKKLSKLNGIAALFEYTTDESGKTEGHLFEWK
jgi:hypothetical protein